MTLDELKILWEKYNDEYLMFSKIKNPLHHRRDICALLMLDKIKGGTSSGSIIDASEHDEYYIDIDCEKFAAVVSEQQIIDLIRCGVRYDTGLGCFCIFT